MDQATSRRVLVFIVLWFGYGSTYLLRKPLGIIKTDLETNLGLSKSELGWMDLSLLMPYALVQMLAGSVGDRLGPRLTMSFCLIVSALFMYFFQYVIPAYGWMCFFLFVNGAAQSLAWPATSKALNAYYPAEMRNSVFGVFGTCCAVGGIGGTALAIYIQNNYSWTLVYTFPSLVVGCLGLLTYLVVNVPKTTESLESRAAKSAQVGASIRELVRFPELVLVTIAIFCLKLVRYVIYMWIPLYLLNILGYSKVEAGLYSTTFEIGGVLGSALIGVCIDKYFKGRSILGCSICISCSAVSLLLFVLTQRLGAIFNILLLFLAGLFNCGPDNILGGSVPAEITERLLPGAASAAVGFVNGFGNIGSMIEGPLVGYISDIWGFSGMLYMIVGLCIVGALASFQGAKIVAVRSKGYIAVVTS